MASSTVGMQYSTFKKWKNELDSRNTWLKCRKCDICMHKNALNILNKPASIQEFFAKAPVDKAISSISGETRHRIGKLVDSAYVLVQEENTDYFINCCDGSTDVSYWQRMVFVMFINQDTSAVEFKYLKITDLRNSPDCKFQ
ncbi:hypothetical protein PR048_033029 [Dryococelus australis]|uniref:Uncharacterized protein n=1 Tax=Dryococelus australis TaxID=614101 RepID=A0ABQ9G3Y0_9NEOP|nr:hypothetical protein PR048_033029 [Dryococelus australis]